MSGFLWKDSANSGVPCVLVLLLLLMGWCDTVVMLAAASTSQVVNPPVVSPRLLYIQPGFEQDEDFVRLGPGSLRIESPCKS